MAPTLLALGAAALALVGNVSAARFYLDETYDQSNFFDKWDFFVSDYNSPDYNDVDPTSGYVNYRSRHDATQLGLIKQLGDEMYIGVNSHDVTQFPGVGRDSVRIESKSLYNEGLMIARFTHLPKPVCGSWPAFWSFGDPWPTLGELDFYEGWNDGTINKPVIHTDHAAINGNCSLTNKGQTSIVTHDNCDTWAGIWDNQGCTTETTHEDPYGSDEGGIYAVEWTDEAIKFYSWTWANRPANIDSETPDTSTWGTPSVLIASPSCEVKNHFKNHKLVINITFCGKAAGNDGIWAQSCLRSTRTSCSAYVAENPADFEDTYWQVKDIRHFSLTRPPVTSTSSVSSASSASSTSSSSSISSTSAASSTSSAASSTTSVSSSTISTTSVASSSAEPSSIASEEPSSAISSELDVSSTAQEASSTISSEASVTSSEADSSSTFSSANEAPASSTESDTPSSTITSAASSSASDEGSSSVEASVSAPVSEDASISASALSDVASSSADVWASSTPISVSSEASSSKVSVFVPSHTYYPVPSQSHYYGNSSTAPPPYPISSSTSSCIDDEPTTTYKTSTVYSTRITTITSGPTYVPNCEHRTPQIVAEVVPAYTTICPVEVSTRTIKHVHTITSCPPSVPSAACPYGSKSTETLYSTITKVLEEPPKPTGTDNSKYDEETDDHKGHDSTDDEDDEDIPLIIIPTTTKYVYQTAAVVPHPPVYSPTPPKNVTIPFRDGHEQISYPTPDLQAAATSRSVSAGLVVALGAAVAILAL